MMEKSPPACQFFITDSSDFSEVEQRESDEESEVFDWFGAAGENWGFGVAGRTGRGGGLRAEG
jgi:hypothetical protein